MIKNQELANEILGIIETLIEASWYLRESSAKQEYTIFNQVLSDTTLALNCIKSSIAKIKDQEKFETNIDGSCENALYSLGRIANLEKSRSKNILDKIEFEFIPILEDMYLQFYFWACVYPDKEKMENYFKNEIVALCANKYIDYAEQNGEYKYDVSFVVTAYNKLEYTKLCVESLLEYMPQGLKYELILLNHGSTDGTKEYFESILPTKQVDILKNGASPTVGIRILEGRYTLSVSNDVIVTQNAIDNMIRCMESDEKIAWVVPTTPNVSNLQTIEANYDTIESMHAFAKKNNVSDKNRWEQRVRLCDPIDIKRNSAWFSSNGIGWGGYFTDLNMTSFPDDKISLALRRKGYKMMLAKDAYCYHFGSVTLKAEVEEETKKTGKDFYTEGRVKFKDVFGIDPWGTGFCWDLEIFSHLPCNESGHVNILGINCGMGSNPLKIKESIKENVHNLDVTTYNVTDEECYIEDLRGVSDVTEYIDNLGNINGVFPGIKFNYIVFESNGSNYNDLVEMIAELDKRILKDGVIAVKVIDDNLLRKVVKNNAHFIRANAWVILKQVTETSKSVD